MFAKVLLPLLLLGVAQQGLAQSTVSSQYSYDVYDVIEGAVNVYPYLGLSSAVSRGFEYCKTLLNTVVAEIKSAFATIAEMRNDVNNVFKDFKTCNSKPSEEIKACKEAVKKNFNALLKIRIQSIWSSYRAAFYAGINLPICIFKKQ